jgi:hypothetical protein
MTIRPAFRQDIQPGQSGRDVKAVKIAYRRMGFEGAGAMVMNNRAGPAFVHVTRRFQFHHGVLVDGVYGRVTHDKLAGLARDGRRAFSPYAAMLYRTAKIRVLPPPPEPNLGTTAAALKLMHYYAAGKLRDDSGRDHEQIRRASLGEAVWSQAGVWVHLDRRILDALLYLIEQGHTVGTFAICSDHHFDSMLGHAGGHAVDISSFDGVSIAAHNARAKTLTAAKLLHGFKAPLNPWQEISGGYGYILDSEIMAETIPSPGFYGGVTMREHTNHIHLGYE